MGAPPASAPGDGWHMAQPVGFGALAALPGIGAPPGGAAMGPLYSAAQAAAEQ
jgi:hypothetical protein